MESAFSSSAEAVLQREAGAAGLLTPLADLDRVYELQRVVGFVRDLACQRVALQFPDGLLGDAGVVAARLEEATGSKMFIMGDTAYGSCCVDVLGAEQAGVHALVHFGPACLSPPARPLPVAFVLGQRPVALELCAQAFEAQNPDPTAPVALLSEPACAHALEALATLLRPRYTDLLVASPALPLPVGSLNSEPEPLQRFGRRFPLAPGRCLEEYDAFYVGGSGASSDPDLDPDLSRLLLGWAPERSFSSCCPDTGETRDEGARAGRLRAHRQYLVERARDARVVGLLVGTLGVARHREALAHLRSLTRAAGKHSYVLALGRPTPPKLANFPEVDVFVLLACPLGALAPQPPGGFFRPVLSPCELEAACNPAWPSPGPAPYLTHYADLLPGSPFHVPLPPPESELWDIPDVSLITGELRPPPAWKPPNDPGCSALTPRPQLELVESSPAGAAGFSADMAKPRNPPCTTSSENGTKGIRKEIDPKFLRNTRFAKKHDKKRHVNNTNAVSTRAKAIKAFIKPKEVKLRSQRVAAASSVNMSTSFTPNLGNVLVSPSLRVSRTPGQRPRQGLNQASGFSCSCSSGLGSQRCPDPHKGSTGEEASADVRTEGLV